MKASDDVTHTRVCAHPDTYPDDLGAGVVRRATARLQHRALHLQRRHAEVGHADVVLLVQQQVLRLQVAVTVGACDVTKQQAL